MTPDDILKTIQKSPVPMHKRDIARVLRIKGSGPRALLKEYLRDLVKSGAISKMRGGLYTLPDGLPPVAILTVTKIDDNGDCYAAPQDKPIDYASDIIVRSSAKYPAPGVGDSVLARLKRINEDSYEARVIKIVGKDETARARIVGLIEIHGQRAILKPANKKDRDTYEISTNNLNGAKDGDLVAAEIDDAKGSLKRKSATVKDVFAHENDTRAISLLSLHESGLQEEFPSIVIESSEGLEVPAIGKRKDLRKIPLITIDGADARDFDDAVYAEPDGEGFHIIVAIADVAHYVRPNSALDKEAYRRGNSTYFADRVVPMLPEALSNDLCSLRPDEDRACMAAHLWIDKNGDLKQYKFVRGLMQSHARMTYEQVQALYDDNKASAQIKNLYDAYRILQKSRQKRGALDLDLPERQIVINDQGEMTGVHIKKRLESHQLIEELMILANVAAASALEAKRDPKQFPCIYRVHDTPTYDKIESAREFLQGFDLSLPKTGVTQPSQINHVLHLAKDHEYSHLISQIILRAQNQAIYSTDNVGHFGLALDRYAHFTSPIRRYADLIVHRSLISAYGLGEGGISDEERVRVNEIAEHISKTERTSIEAERNAADRFTAAYLSHQTGADFRGSINGVTQFGLFVTLDDTGADGIVPMRSLNNDYYEYNEPARALVGKRKGRVFRLGASVTVTLKEASALTGSTVFTLTDETLSKGADIPGMPPIRSPMHARPKNADRKNRKNNTHKKRAPSHKKGARSKGKSKNKK